MTGQHDRDRIDAERPLSCDEVREHLVPWLDDEVVPDQARRISAHVAGCPVCAREVDLHRRVGSALDAVYAARPEAARDVVLRVRRRIDRDRRAASSLRRAALGIAAGVLLAAALWWVSSGEIPGGGEDRSVAVGDAAVEEELLENLDVLEALEEALEDAEVDLTPELVQALLGEDGPDELDEIFEYVLEEEVLSDQL